MSVNKLLELSLSNKVLTDQQVNELMMGLHQIVESTSSAGAYFTASLRFAQSELDRICAIAEARGLNSNPNAPTCPHCLAKLNVPDCVTGNIQAYGKSPLIATSCCSKPVRISGSMSFSITATQTDRTEDDWGDPFKK